MIRRAPITYTRGREPLRGERERLRAAARTLLRPRAGGRQTPQTLSPLRLGRPRLS